MSEAAAAAGFSRLLSDDRLTRRAVGGDERAFAAIFDRYHQSLYRFCLTIVGNPEDAQDALQNAMAKVLAALPGEEREIELKPWLYRIAHNESIDLIRRRRETRQLDVEQVAPGHGLAEDVETRERLRRLLDDLRELPERQREVLVMREMAGLDFDEIGAALETTGAAARQTLYEGRQALAQMEGGREMDCDSVTRALSDGDGRVTRRRDVRAHLRSCAQCRRFRDEIDGRRRDLAALSPLPAVAAAGLLQGILGGSGAASSGGIAAALGGGAAKTVAGSALAKGMATAAVVAAVGVTAADRTGVIHLGLPGEKSVKAGSPTPGASDGGNSSTGPSGAAAEPSSPAAKAAAGHGEKRSAKGKTHRATAGSPPAANAAPAGKEHGQGAAHANPHAETKSQGAPAGAGNPEKELPSASAGGQEAAAEHKPEQNPGQGGQGGQSGVGSEKAPGGKPPAAEAPDPPAKGPPENPPQGAAPSPPPQAQQPNPPGKPAEPPAAGSPANPGKGGETGKGRS